MGTKMNDDFVFLVTINLNKMPQKVKKFVKTILVAQSYCWTAIHVMLEASCYNQGQS